jgi:enediyne biosynthesis protein E4
VTSAVATVSGLGACLVVAARFLLGGQGRNDAEAYSGPMFEDVAARRGLSASHVSSPDKRYIVESMSGGAGLFDCDGDGRLDIVLANGSTVDRYRTGGDPMVVLYHQEADGSFKDATVAAGMTRRGWGMGVAVADADNDGRLDLYVTGYGGNAFYRNLGDCRFVEEAEAAGLRLGGFSTGAAFGDYDRDGHVDLFVARYVHVDMQNLPRVGKDKNCLYRGIPVQCGPWGLQGEGDFLFRNRGDGRFEDVSKSAGVHDAEARYGMGVVWADYDNDDWPDLFVANDAGENYLYHNERNGSFREQALAEGVALSGDGVPLGNMGVDAGDFDRDGRLDLVDTTFENQDAMLYQNQGAEGFVDVSRKAQVAVASSAFVKWGTSFVDFDNDGWRDLLIASGHVVPQVDLSNEGYYYRQPLRLHLNRGDGTFADRTAPAGLGALPLASRRGAAFGDVNDDGAVDVLVLNVGEPPSLLLNRLHNGHHWIAFALTGTKSNRAAIGARLVARTGPLSQLAEVRGGTSYLSQNDLRAHFGLGRSARLDSLDVRWPSGRVDHWSDLEADRLHVLEEGKAPAPSAKRLPRENP